MERILTEISKDPDICFETVFVYLNSPCGFALKKYLHQTFQAAYEIRGVYCLEYGDNQHAQSSLVRASSQCDKAALHVCVIAARFRKKSLFEML